MKQISFLIATSFLFACHDDSGEEADAQEPVQMLVDDGPVVCDGSWVVGSSEDDLLVLSDTETLGDMYDVAYRIDTIGRIFEACKDRRGLFATVYRPITELALVALEDGFIADEAWSEDLIVDFAARYFDNLHLELSWERPSWAWDRYYGLAANGDVSATRVAATGVVVHLLVDLPASLVAIGTGEEHKEDYFRFGEVLVTAAPIVVEDLKQRHDVDAEDLFSGFFLGDWVDGVFGDAATTGFAFQTVRRKAWNNRWYIQTGLMAWVAEGEIYSSFWTIDAFLASLDATGTI